MAKVEKRALTRLQSAARLTRTALAARLLAHGLYAGQEQIIMALAERDGQTPGQLAARLGVRPPTITKTINRLQSQGFVSKQASETDARQAHVFLAEAGREVVRSIEKSLKKTEKEALKGLDKKDQKALAKLLGQIEANLSSVVEESDDEENVEEQIETAA